MPIAWAAALRLYGKQKGHFVVPRKGSPDYDAVKKIQMETADGPEHAVKKRVSKKKSSEVVVAEAHEPTTKAKKAPTRKGGAAPDTTRDHNPIVPPAQGTKPLEAAGGAGSKAQDLKEEPVVKEESKKKAPKRRGVKASGLTAAAATFQELTEKNLMDGGAAAAQLPGQKERIKKSLAKKEGEEKMMEVGDGSEKTLEGLKSDDPVALSGRRPFSFQALRNQLLC
jgi:hypothetical protein